MSRNARAAFVTDETGPTWLAKGDFLGRHDNGAFVRLKEISGASFCIAASRSGGIWVAGRDRISSCTSLASSFAPWLLPEMPEALPARTRE